jgi:hypothetical protein
MGLQPLLAETSLLLQRAFLDKPFENILHARFVSCPWKILAPLSLYSVLAGFITASFTTITACVLVFHSSNNKFGKSDICNQFSWAKMQRNRFVYISFICLYVALSLFLVC